MGFLDKLLGRSAYFPDTDDYVPSRKRFLGAVAQRAGIEHAQLVANTDRRRVELSGTLGGVPLVVALRSDGVVDISLDHHHTLADIELALDPDVPRGLELAPRIYEIGGERGVAAFRALPAELQARVLGELRRLGIRALVSRGYWHKLDFVASAATHADPVAWLADALRLISDVAAARGVHGPAEEKPDHAARVEAFARELAAAVPGATIARIPNKPEADVRWQLDGIDLVARVSGTFFHVELSTPCDAPGELELYWGEQDPEPTDIFFGPHLSTGGVWIDVAASAALLRGLPLLDELGATMASARVGVVELDHGRLGATFDTLDGLTAERVIAFARLLLRVAAALPHHPPAASPPDGHCDECDARYYRDRGAACPNCGAE